MSATIDESNIHKQLRDKAEALLQAGTAPTATHRSLGVDALRLLHRLSRSPDSAEDALKLLHELQVHQVELDLQNEEIAANERGLLNELDLYRTLYDSAPAGYFVVDLDGIVIQGNLAAAKLFGISQNDLEGQRIDAFLNPQNRPLLLDLLQNVAQCGTGDCYVADAGGGAQGFRHLQFLASIPPGREHILLICCACGNAK